jgi:hypothetical protein
MPKYIATQKDLDNLDKMITEVPYEVYHSAANRLGVKPKPRPVVREAVQAEYVSLMDQNKTVVAFLAQHQELKEGGHWDFNTGLIKRWLDDFQMPATMTNLGQAYSELSSHDMFRTASAGKRGGKLVRQYDPELLQADRTGRPSVQTARVKVQTPQGSFDGTRAEVLQAAHNVVAQAHPDWNPNSGKFQKAVDDVLKQKVRATYKPERAEYTNWQYNRL